MSNENKEKTRKKKRKREFTVLKAFKMLIVLLVIAGILAGGALGGIALSIIKDAPDIDPSNINATLAQTSNIVDINGGLIEKIQAPEFRTVVSLNEIPQHLLDAFIAIEDERFYDHMGVDPLGIIGAIMDNFKSGNLRGASTITQQLARNLYLSNEVSWTRKITEAYLAFKIERVLTKDQILEAYLNRSSFGQNAYGVQEAARTYFSKDVDQLTISESALIAGIVKGPNIYQPYMRIKPEDYDSSKHYEVGQIDVLGKRYILVFNPTSVERQKLVLSKMLDLEKITQAQYDEAINQDIKLSLKPEEQKNADITSYFTDYVKSTVVDALEDKLGYTPEDAEKLLFSGGLTIYATIDIEMQKQLEDIYENFTEILVGNTNSIRGPILVDWNLNRAGNVLDDRGNLIFYSKSNLMTEDYRLILENGTYTLENGDIIINNRKLTPYPKHIDVGDFYTIDERKNLVTHTVGSIVIPEGEFTINDDKSIRISKAYLDKNQDFYTIENGNLVINSKYYYVAKDGIVQPQSASTILDYRTGHIKAIVGGRDVEGQRILNRATDSARQPGSAIKPIAVYLPALDNGYTAASAIDDIPFYNGNGKLWPKNWYTGYRGIHTLRRSVEQSVNVNSVKTLQSIGVGTSMAYLEKMGIIDKDHPERDNIVTRNENPNANDENLSALGLGGMTKGLSPLELTAAFGAIANNGKYVEPIAFTKIIDKNGNLLLDNTPKETIVVSPQVAYIMGDILRTTVSDGLAGRAKLSNMAVAGKTGTTNEQVDIWFVGYTPYYASSVWIGNDSPKITISKGSSTAASLWQHINTRVHENLESKTTFERPNGIISSSICTQSGLLATNLCAQDPRGVIKTELFAEGTVPTKHCDMHVALKVDTSTNRLANKYCPDNLISTRIFIQRTPPYDPGDHNGIVPSDYNYNAPTRYCTKHNETTIIVDPLEEWFNEWFNNDGKNKNGNEEVVPEEVVPLEPILD
ncbi:PBP1A family penicillin-binding protein [Tissierella creatinini]|nr:PBP1A family penicillin-binding protein [Tissierella creatinini]TJX67142.1 PBP1A family penicillin-binding protein [Soehngenia saccharolytica]